MLFTVVLLLDNIKESNLYDVLLVGWLCLTSHRQRGHLETAPPLTFPCEGRELDKYTVPTGN